MHLSERSTHETGFHILEAYAPWEWMNATLKIEAHK